MDDTHTFFWLAGLFEGEACFLYCKRRQTPIIELEMKDEHVVARVAAIFTLSYARRDRRLRNPKSQVTYRIRIAGRRAMHLMKRLQPYLSPRRARTIELIEQRFLAEREERSNYTRLPLPPLTEVPYTVNR